MKTRKLFYRSLLVFIISGTVTSCNVQKNISKATNKVTSVDESKITLQERTHFTFNKGSLIFSNKFLTGRLNRIEQMNDSTFESYRANE